MRSSRIRSTVKYNRSMNTTAEKLRAVTMDWMTGQPKNNWTCFVNMQQDCLSMPWLQSGSLTRRTRTPRNSWITSYSHKRVGLRGRQNLKKTQHLIHSTSQFFTGPSVTVTQRMIPRSSWFLVLWSWLQILSLHPPLPLCLASTLEVYSPSLSRTGIFHVLFTSIFIALTLVVTVQVLFQAQAYTPCHPCRLLTLFQTIKKIKSAFIQI